ncbi:MAG: CD3324 family protein [Defluviitaleaceae bacterium]|nr:CD3324 family protein [Defluviitaleaceae bacterium]
MGYKKVICVLPSDLLMAVQQYVDGEYIYIPRKAENKKQWGELKNSRHQLDKRNLEIYAKYQNGVSVKELSLKYYLSPKTIYKILSAIKKSS